MADADFNGLSIHRVTATEFDCVKKFLLTDFLYNEPLNRSINLKAEDSDELFNDLVNVGIASSLSYILRGPDGEIVALRLTSILDRPKEEHHNEDNELSTRNKSVASDNSSRTATKVRRYCPRAQIIVDILQELENKMWMLINPELKRLLLWSVISVHKNYTRRGLAEKMLCYKLDEAKQIGCQGCIAEASAFKSQLLFKKIGYETIHEVKHGEWLDDRGQQIFRCDDSTNSIQLVFKSLE
ncbi:acetyltransferase [Loa loa]|uniref:aralkylamine N-acetyltransferase n=1 Tax=Loa loa TaxID=7209 RepID=A0A1I7VLA6_LOALO|nr:acetyltransferase [Loa loa]EFO16199.2 acetyltransferase [Loa loa]